MGLGFGDTAEVGIFVAGYVTVNFHVLGLYITLPYMKRVTFLGRGYSVPKQRSE